MTTDLETPATKADSLAVLFASQTGNAEWIAKHIHEEALARGIASTCHVLDDHAQANLTSNNALIIVASTTGDGDPPDNATKFWRFLRRAKGADLEAFKSKRYAVLGLGDTNYSNFCNTSKRLEKKMNDLGAVAFTKSGFADDATGLEAVVDPWLKKLWKDLLLVVECDQDKLKAFEETAGKEESKFDMGKFGVAKKVDDKKADGKSAPVKETDAKAVTSANAPKNSAGEPSVASVTADAKALSVSDASPPAVDKTDKSSVADQFTPSPTGHITSKPVYTPVPIVISETALQAATTLTGVAKLPAAFLEVEAVPEVSRAPADSRTTYFRTADRTSSSAFDSTARTPFHARITRVRCLTGPKALKRVLEIELDLGKLGWEYTPGDAFAIVCPNPDEVVLPLIARLSLDAASTYMQSKAGGTATQGFPFAMDAPLSVYEMFRYHLDLHAFPKKSFLRLLAEHTTDADEKKTLYFLASTQGAGEYRNLKTQQPTLLDFLTSFPKCNPPLARLLENIPHLQPRYYSVASSRATSPSTVTFAFNVVEYATPAPFAKPVVGLCSTFLDQLTGCHREPEWKHTAATTTIDIPIFPKPRPDTSHPFQLPADPATPIIMIAAGTGISPFMSFLADRHHCNQNNTAAGEAWLFHGCRFQAPDGDALYEPELTTYLRDKSLTRLTRCFSRHPATNPSPPRTPPSPASTYKYVQDALRAHAAPLTDLLFTHNAYIYVCGSIAMAKDVNMALADVLVTAGRDEGVVRALERLNEWNKQGRYLKDLWT
ncbi:hypothetical protein PhCBS80983_g03352 [Powellomyces hirtus]|uniref:Methionine synthase reductase n=1 Tax=Powellomyces hirtus TaxID=109895 RepID=A0A507E227_9FUNG|nr:hypothetical protein PhCBS80983_g03352 [Powellomyces hirtus]